MKIQNLSIIFIVIMMPIIMMLSFYIDRQTDTLELQEAYNTKMITSSKNAIKAFEINTVDWASTNTSNMERRTVDSMVSTFTNSLASEMGIAGTAREYMLDYIPAIVVNMYDGYYIYAPTYTYKNALNSKGRQLFVKDGDRTASNQYFGEPGSKVLYIAKSGKGVLYKNIDETIQYDFYGTTDVSEAEATYENELSAKISYTSAYKQGNLQAVVNYTLDNRIYVYGLNRSTQEAFSKDGYLVYFDYGETVLPQIKIKTPSGGAKAKEDDIVIDTKATRAIYATKTDSGNINKVLIGPEELTEQIVYKSESGNDYITGTFTYIYDIKHQKIYYDKTSNEFFVLNNEYERETLNENATKNDCKWKSVSVLLASVGETNNKNITEYKKFYQALNGVEKGKWFINLNPDAGETEENEIIDTQIKYPGRYGLTNIATYQDCSAISYYVESYAFTNWVRKNLGNNSSQIKMQYTEGRGYESVEDNKASDYVKTSPYNADNNLKIGEIFNISQTNNPEDPNSIFSLHKREVMKENITENITLAISNYNEGGNSFEVPVLTENDWDTMFENISILAYMQGMPIGLKTYNNYCIATSKMNDAYVDPNGIYLSSSVNASETDQKYHLPYCSEVKNIEYTGYRNSEYVLRKFSKKLNDVTIEKSYYMHDNRVDDSSELGCYNCIVNRGVYKSLTNSGEEEEEQKVSKQMQSYDEALARERYYQLQKVKTKLFYEKDVKIKSKTKKITTSTSSEKGNMVVILDYEYYCMTWHNSHAPSSKSTVQGLIDGVAGNANIAFVQTCNPDTVITNTSDLSWVEENVSEVCSPDNYEKSVQTAVNWVKDKSGTRCVVFLTWTDKGDNEELWSDALNILINQKSDYDVFYSTFCCGDHGQWDVSEWHSKLGEKSGGHIGGSSITERFSKIASNTVETEEIEETVQTSNELKIELENLDTSKPIIVYINGTPNSINYGSDVVYSESGKYYIDLRKLAEKLGKENFNEDTIEIEYSKTS